MEEKDPITSDEFIGPVVQKQLDKEEQYKAQQEFAKHKVLAKQTIAMVGDKKKKKPTIVVVDDRKKESKEPDCHKSKLESGDHSFGKQMNSRRGFLMRFCSFCGTIEFYTSVDKKPVSWIPKKIVEEYEKNKKT